MKMKRNRSFLIVGFCVLLSIFLVFSTTVSATNKVTITGTVYGDNWDDKDNVIAVVIETADGEFYTVSNDAKGKELFKLVDKNVKVTGVVEDTDGEKIITVIAYEVME